MSKLTKFTDIYKHILSVGVELEGGVCIDEFKARLYPLYKKYGDKTKRIRFGYDRSVDVQYSEICGDDDYDDDYYCPDCMWKSDAEVRFHSIYFEEIEFFVKAFFDSYGTQNDTCGNHVHVRFRNHIVAYNSILNENFYRDFIREYRRFANKIGSDFGDEAYRKYISRLRNRYSKVPEDIKSALYLKDRYVAVNFISLIEQQHTVEFRILPYAYGFNEYMFALRWLLDTVDRLVDKYLREETIEVHEEPIYESLVVSGEED